LTPIVALYVTLSLLDEDARSDDIFSKKLGDFDYAYRTQNIPAPTAPQNDPFTAP
jgi:hypothetical protein